MEGRVSALGAPCHRSGNDSAPVRTQIRRRDCTALRRDDATDREEPNERAGHLNEEVRQRRSRGRSCHRAPRRSLGRTAEDER